VEIHSTLPEHSLYPSKKLPELNIQFSLKGKYWFGYNDNGKEKGEKLGAL
jgi:hypothetical protein